MASGDLLGAIIQVTQPDEGDGGVHNVYTVEQIKLPRLPAPPGRSYDFSLGPLEITTNIDIPKKEFCVTLSVVGISLGKFCGSFDNGFSIDVNIFVAKGSVRFYVKNGNQLWVRVDLDVTFDGGYHQDAKIIDF